MNGVMARRRMRQRGAAGMEGHSSGLEDLAAQGGFSGGMASADSRWDWQIDRDISNAVATLNPDAIDLVYKRSWSYIRRNILSEPQVVDVAGKTTDALLGGGWTVHSPQNPTRRERAAADHMRYQLENMQEDLLASLREMVALGTPIGWALAEIVLERRGELWELDRIAPRRQEQYGYKIDRHGRVERVIYKGRYGLGHKASYDPRRFLRMVFGLEVSNPYGTSSLDHIAAWITTKRIIRIAAARYVDRFGMPTSTVSSRESVYGNRVDPNVQAVLKESVNAALRQAGSVPPPGWEVKLLEASGQGVAVFDTLIRICDAQIVKPWLWSPLMSDVGPGGDGSSALGTMQADQTVPSRAIARLTLASRVNNQTVWPVHMANYGVGVRRPTMTLNRDRYEALAELTLAAQGIRDLVDRGMRVPEQHMHEISMIPEALGDEALLQPYGAGSLRSLTGVDNRLRSVRGGWRVDSAADANRGRVEHHALRQDGYDARAREGALAASSDAVDRVTASALADGAAVVTEWIEEGVAQAQMAFRARTEALMTLDVAWEELAPSLELGQIRMGFYGGAITTLAWLRARTRAEAAGEVVGVPELSAGRRARTLAGPVNAVMEKNSVFEEYSDEHWDELRIWGLTSEISTPEMALDAIGDWSVLTRDEFSRLADTARQQSLTVAGATRDQLENVFRDQLRSAIAEGWDLDRFERSVRARTDSFASNHLELVYRENVGQAYRDGCQAAVFANDEVVALEYHAVGDSRTRSSHMALDGLVLGVDDPFWRTHWPPWDWNCRCDVLPVHDFDLRNGYAELTDGRLAGAAKGTVPDAGYSMRGGCCELA